MNTDSIATFQKVSFEEYRNMRVKTYARFGEKTDDELFEEWMSIKLPERATTGSAGYDFYVPMKATIECGENGSVLIPTGIRAKIKAGWVLMLFPRSGLGTKFGFGLDNTVGIIDSDYFEADNEGHIMAKIHVNKELSLNQGDRFVQGVFLPFGTATNDDVTVSRHGGFGSTDAK